MEASAGLVAGSHNRNELVVIRRDGTGGGGGTARRAEAPVCQICGNDLEGEFGLDGREDDPQYVAEAMMRAQMSYGRGGDPQPFQHIPNVPLLTNGQMVDDIPPKQHALVPSYMGGGGGGGKRIHPFPFADPNLPGGCLGAAVQPRSMDSLFWVCSGSSR